MKNIRFCQKLMSLFEIKDKSILNLVIALASNKSAHSPTELALNPLYKYQYSSICDAIENFLKEKEKPKIPEQIAKTDLDKFIEKETILRAFLKEFFPEKEKDKFWLLNTDVTSIYREHSPTLKDKEFVHAANTVIKNNKPVTIGIRLSTVGLSLRQNNIAWNPAISMLKVPFEQKNSEFAAQQINIIMEDEKLFETDLVVNALDSAYCNIGYAYSTNSIENLVSIVRIAGHRNVFHCYTGELKTGKGAKNKYGKRFKLSEVDTLPNQTEQFEFTMKNGRKCNVLVKQWKDMIIKGKRNKKMYNKPFNLVSVQLTDILTGEPIYKKTLWLTVWGQRRDEITLRQIYESYRTRFDIEFLFRFGKQNLLLDKFQTPDATHQQNWFWIVLLAYWLLYLSRQEGENIIRPWEKYNKSKDQDVKELENKTVKTPTQTQRTMETILCEFTKTALIPKPRNIYSGRAKGEKQTPREHFNVVKKGIKLQI